MTRLLQRWRESNQIDPHFGTKIYASNIESSRHNHSFMLLKNSRTGDLVQVPHYEYPSGGRLPNNNASGQSVSRVRADSTYQFFLSCGPTFEHVTSKSDNPAVILVPCRQSLSPLFLWFLAQHLVLWILQALRIEVLAGMDGTVQGLFSISNTWDPLQLRLKDISTFLGWRLVLRVWRGGRGRGASGGTARSLLFKKQASRGPSTEPPTASNSRKSIPYVIIAAMARSTRRGGGGEDLWVERRFEKRKLSSLHCRGCWVLKACDL